MHRHLRTATAETSVIILLIIITIKKKKNQPAEIITVNVALNGSNPHCSLLFKCTIETAIRDHPYRDHLSLKTAFPKIVSFILPQ